MLDVDSLESEFEKSNPTKIKLLKAVSFQNETRASSNTAAVSENSSLPDHWEICHDEDDNEYYYNSNTGESQWERPYM